MSHIEDILHRVAHLLPSQGPLDVFVHHNTLHAFEELPFLKALDVAGDIYGARSFLPESQYQAAFLKSRIDDHDLRDAILEVEEKGPSETNQWIEQVRACLLSATSVCGKSQVSWCLSEREDLNYQLDLFASKRWDSAVAHEAAWFARVDATKREEYIRSLTTKHWCWSTSEEQIEDELNHLLSFSPHSVEPIALRCLWFSCLTKATQLLPDSPPSHSGKRGSRQTSINQAMELALPVITKLAAGFLDRGIGGWPLPQREEGFFQAALTYLAANTGVKPWIIAGIEREVHKLQGRTSTSVIELILKQRGLSEDAWEEALRKELMDLKGWGGFMHLIEAHTEVSACSSKARIHALTDFTAVKMLIEAYGAEKIHQAQQNHAEIGEEAMARRDPVYSTAYHMFRWCQMLGVTSSSLSDFPVAPHSLLHELFTQWGSTRRERVWHIAYERNFERRTYNAFLNRARTPYAVTESPRFQILCCIDDREESFRRYLEEMGDHIVTFGTAGFFGIDMQFEELGKTSAPYCPVVITPTHKVAEVVRPDKARNLQRALSIESSLHRSMNRIAGLSHRFTWSWLSALSGPVMFLPMILRTLFPRVSHLIEQRILERLRYNTTDVMYSCEEAIEDSAEKSTDAYRGFSPSEMADRVSGLLSSIGLISDFAPIITVIGHGSSSKNNPFKSAYDCGACGGRPGRVNARVFAQMANRRDVREILRETKGIDIPDSVLFVGAYHDTCNDAVTLFDIEGVSENHSTLLLELRYLINCARARNAEERCRRFAYAVRTSPQTALAYVEGRAHNIAEPRPEYGHATNAICIVGRRNLTRGLFLDRRAFLVSYDPSVDPNGSILIGTLRAVVPVCVGINLEYFFSSIDNEKYGAGNKLPTNITSLIGIITGYASDLRTGLPAQMVEIHEPVRLTIIIDAPLARVLSALDALPAIATLVRNEWFILSVYDEATGLLTRVKGREHLIPWSTKEAAPSEVWGEEMLTEQNSGPLPFVAIH